MKYEEWSKEDLITKIHELEEALEKEIDVKNNSFLVEFPWLEI